MLRSYVFLIGARYGLSRRHSQLVTFISRLSMLGLIIGVALLILVISIMNGFDRDLRENILGVMPQASIYHRQAIDDPEKVMNIANKDPRVIASSPFVQTQGLLALRKNVSPVMIYGIDPTLERETSSIHKYVDETLLLRLQHAEDVILIGRGVAEKLSTKVGDKISLLIPSPNAQQSPVVKIVTVLGIINTNTEIDNAFSLMNIKSAAVLTAFPESVTGVRLKINDLFSAPEIAFDVVSHLPKGYYGSSWMRTHGNIYQAIQMSKNLVGLLLFLIIAIAAFNLVSTLIMVVVDKQGSIAILRTMGASTLEIMGVFMIQGGIIGSIGALVGLILGAILSWLVTPFVQLVERVFGIQFLHSDVYPITYLPSDFHWQDGFYVAFIALMISFVATLYPAWRASRVQPADALRYE